MVRRISLLLLTVAALLSVATTNSHAQTVLTHHVREATRTGRAQAIGRLPQNQIMQLDLVLPLRDSAGLTSFLNDVYDPSSFSYHQFLTPAEFTERFGPRPTMKRWSAMRSRMALKSPAAAATAWKSR